MNWYEIEKLTENHMYIVPWNTHTAVNWSKRRQAETSTTKTSINQNVDKPKRRQTETPTNQNFDKPKRRQTETSTNRNVDKPKLRQTETSTNQNVDKPKLRQTETSTNQLITLCAHNVCICTHNFIILGVYSLYQTHMIYSRVLCYR